MKVLITGATGFVGACLARHFADTGYDVHIFARRDSNKWRIADLQDRLTNHEVDLRSPFAVERAVMTIRPRIVIHLATYGGFTIQSDSLAIFESNVNGTIHLLRACEKAGFDCFVNTGSSSEYGLKSAPMTERDCLEPLGDYGVSKAASTLYCTSEARGKDLPIVTLRLFSPFGPWDDPKRLIPYVITSFLRGEQPKLSAPQSVRDYIFIDDVLAAYNAVIKNPLPGEVFNIGSGGQHTIGEVVTILQEIISNGVFPLWGARGQERPEPGMWIADIHKAEMKLGWKPSTLLRVGLTRTVEWMRDNLRFYPSVNRKNKS